MMTDAAETEAEEGRKEKVGTSEGRSNAGADRTGTSTAGAGAAAGAVDRSFWIDFTSNPHRAEKASAAEIGKRTKMTRPNKMITTGKVSKSNDICSAVDSGRLDIAKYTEIMTRTSRE